MSAVQEDPGSSVAVEVETDRSHRLNESSWREIVFLFETGKATKTELSRKFNVTWQWISAGLRKRGAIYGSKSAIITDALIEAEKSDSARRAEEVTQMRERQRASIDLLQKIQNNIVGVSIRDGVPLASKYDEIKSLNLLIKNQTMIRSDLWEIYDLHRDPDQAEEMPDFIVSDYNEEELKQINEKTFGKPTEDILTDIAATIGIDIDDPIG